MKLKNDTILELGQIVKDEFNTKLSAGDLEKLACSLVGYFDLLLKIENRHKFGNSSAVPIDQSPDIKLDKGEVK